MAQSGFEWQGYAKLDGQLAALTDVDAMPLMERWADIVIEGNRRGVLSGLDGFNNPMPPLKYRDGAGKKTRNRQVGRVGYGENKHPETGHGPFSTGLHDNLASARYQELTGPRLAPRGEVSRAIKNLHTEIRNPSPGRWEVIGAWYAVVSTSGVPFLPFHFEGAGHNPVYDLRPVRPEDLQFCANAVRAFAKQLFFERF